MRAPRETLFILVLGIVLTVLAYLPSLSAGFFFDDVSNIVEASVLHWTELSWEGFRDVATNGHIARRVVANWTLALNHLGGGLDPRGFHLVNLLIHLLVGVSLAWVCALYSVSGATRADAKQVGPIAAAVTATLFLVHPLSIQAVTYVVQRMSSLAALFSLWSFGLYLLGRQSRSRVRAGAWFVLALVAWILALGSKENALVLPLVIGTHELCFHAADWVRMVRSIPRRRQLWILLAATAATACVVCWLYTTYLGGVRLLWDETFPRRDFNGGERLLTQGRVQLFYLGLFLWPTPSRLNLEHEFSVSRSLVDPPLTLLSWVFWVLIMVAAIYWTGRKPRYSFPVLMYLLLHLIESGPFDLELVFEHRMYLPMTALAMLGTAVVVDLSPRWRRVALGLALVIALPLTVATYQRNETWSDFIGFHLDSAKKSPGKYRAQYNLGTELANVGRYEEALPYLRRAAEIRPEGAQAHNQLGTAYLRLGLLDQALPEFELAVRLKPDHAYAHYNLAWVLDRQGRGREAIVHYQQFLLTAPAKLADFVEPVQRRVRELSNLTAVPSD